MGNRTFIVLLWLGSSLPIGVALWVLPSPARVSLWAAAIVLDNAHRLAPIIMGWCQRDFRQVLLTIPRKTIGLPLLLLVLASTIGAATSLGYTSFISRPGRQLLITDLTNPFPVLMWIYIVWNAYHFGMQNFGVVSLLRGERTSWQRACDMSWTVGATVAGMLTVPGMVEFNHWIVELGLCGRVSRRVILLMAAALGFGALHFFWWFPTPNGMAWRVIPWVIGIDVGIGFWHFLQDRWVWRIGNPRVRTAIG